MQLADANVSTTHKEIGELKMSTYTPDVWVIIEIESVEFGKIHKVLAGWYGGFAGSNSWKISSGIESITNDGEKYIMPQSSGSTYICYPNCEKTSMLTHGIFSSLETQAAESNGSFTVKIIDFADLKLATA